MSTTRTLSLCALCAILAGCASKKMPAEQGQEPTSSQSDTQTAPSATTTEDRASASPEWVTPFPHLRINTVARTIEVDGFVSRLIHDGLDGKRYYLEQFVCVPGRPNAGSKEHESLVATEALPSHIHAALLLLGLEPGAPVTWDSAGNPMAAEGPEVRVTFAYEENGARVEVHPVAWTRHIDTGASMPERAWLFSGSTIMTSRGEPFYEADAAGTVIGLASFGGETLSWPEYIDDVEESGDLVWLARTEDMPTGGTPVIIILSPNDP